MTRAPPPKGQAQKNAKLVHSVEEGESKLENVSCGLLLLTCLPEIWFKIGKWHRKIVLGNECVGLVAVGAKQSSKLAKTAILNYYWGAVKSSHLCPLKFLPTENLYFDLIADKLRNEQ